VSARETPHVGEVWTHYKGGSYEILCIARIEKDGEKGELQVVYCEASMQGRTGVWIRPMSDFMAMVKIEIEKARFIRKQ
jgi:hypothetical protein